MNRAFALLIAALALLLPAIPALAQAQAGARVVATISWVEEWDPVSGQWVRVDEDSATLPAPIAADPVRFIAGPLRAAAAAPGAPPQYGPFRVLDARRAALVGATDTASPAAFRAMLAAYPGLEVIEFHDAPGTSNDIANLALGRAIRAAGLATHVPGGGSARSGAVELFLAGTQRSMDPRALFAVHSWRDNAGREPRDFAADAPENRLYLDYYAEMGMGAAEARAFYAMTNSVPHHSALWLRGADMARWVAPEAAPPRARLAAAIDAPLAASLRQALARSGAAMTQVVRGPRALREAAPASPRLALAAEGAGLLDSWAAFP